MSRSDTASFRGFFAAAERRSDVGGSSSSWHASRAPAEVDSQQVTGGPAPTVGGSGPTAPPLLTVRSISKNFGPTVALADCSLEIAPGEVHALLGENGSGKSTLAKIVTGVYAPSAGTIHVGGGDAVALHSPALARSCGIVAVYQEILTAPVLSVLDNVWLGSDGIFRLHTSKETKRRRAAEVLLSLTGRELDLDARVGSLPLHEQQACCIARALVQEFNVLVLDEATSTLDLAVRDRLFGLIRNLVSSGRSVLFVSHRMDEIGEIADRLTVLRSGKTVATMSVADASETKLLELLTGRDDVAPGSRERDQPSTQRTVRMKTRELEITSGAGADAVDIYAGEITALAGLEGHGQEAFLEALWGFGPADGKVYIVGQGSEDEVRSPYAAQRLGIAYVPRDRRTESGFASLSLRQNFELATLERDSQFGLIRNRRTTERFMSFANLLKLRFGDARQLMSSLSGGNQQKVILARWLAMNPEVLLLNDPTRGVDLATKHDVYDILRDLREKSVAVVMLSSEIDEILEIADRVLVFHRDRLAADLIGSDIRRDTILAAYFGIERDVR